ncbi:MAG TPA: alpha-(1-_3)-arabinofuranosyltransferase family protein [Ornithinibacter sp.]|nr:alpha-(1->3)-arabinofuranosyltransferase family protein [Ornithinibacter sp.]
MATVVVETGATTTSDVDPARGRPGPVAERDSTAWVWRLRHLVVSAMFVAVALNTDPGKIVNDTKLDLVVQPIALLRRALHLWDPLGSAGQLQNQAYGYLFPMGPFFAGGEAVGLSPWVMQRLWWGLLLVTSYLGFVLLTRRLHAGTEWTRLVAGVGFALAPHVLTILGQSSVEAWPPALAPWVLLPLVSLGAEGRPRRAALLSGLAVLAMGGVNAAVDLAAVLPAVLWLVTRRWSRAWLRLVVWWGFAVVAATLWWTVPLVTLGQYSPPFLDYIESAGFTTSTTSLVETVRGTADWVAYLGVESTRAGHALLTAPLLVLMTVLLAILGLVGLTWRGTPERVWLVLTLMVGVVLVTLGHVGPVDGFFATDLRTLLDGPLAPLRNVHKFDILIRLSLFVGFASALKALAVGRSPAESRFLRRVVAAGGAFVVLGASTPFFGLLGAPAGSFEEVPGYWTQATRWLDAHQANGRTLLLPGSRFARYDWGTAGDEPMQALATTPWDVRNAVPLSGAGHIRWLDGIERSIADGDGGADLVSTLTAGGVRYLLVRNDLAYGAAQATRPLVVRATLGATDGVELAASFGPLVGGGDQPGVVVDQRLRLPMRAIDIYRVAASGDARVDLVAEDEVGHLVGGAEARTGETRIDRAWVPAGGAGDTGQAAALGAGQLKILTDTARRREVNFGIGTFGASHTLTPEDPLRIVKPARDYREQGDAESVARYLGVESLSASSSASDADAYPRSDPAAMPYAAFDGNASTGWRPNPIKPTAGSWVEVDFGREISLAGGKVQLDVGTSVRRLGLDTDNGPTSLPVRDDRADLPAVSTRRLRLTIDEVEGDRSAALAAAVRDVEIPGVLVRRTVVLPPAPWDTAPDAVVLSGDTGRGGCLTLGLRPLCAPTLARTGEDAAGLVRTFATPRSFAATLRAKAVPAVGSADLERRVVRALELPVTASASSRAVPDLGGAPLGAVDGDLGTAWVAAPTDADPTLSLSWNRKRTLSSISVLLDQYVAATRPTSLVIASPDGERTVPLDGSGHGSFEPLRTDEVALHLQADDKVRTVDPYTLEVAALGLGASEVVLDPVTSPVRPAGEHVGDATSVILRCGEGPVVAVGDERVRTRAWTSVGDLRSGRPIDLAPCDHAGLTVRGGETTVLQVDPSGSPLLVSDVRLSRVGVPVGDASSPGEDAVVQGWSSTRREVTLGPRQSQTVLVVRENANDGWQATVDGEVLARTTVNGWQQGYVVPAGGAATVRLDFLPDGPYRMGLVAGALAVLALVALVLLPERARADRAVVAAGRRARPAALLAGVVAMALVGGWAGLLVVAVVLALAWALHRMPLQVGRRRIGAAEVGPVVVALSFAGAGMALARGGFGTSAYAGNAPLTQVLVLVALAVVTLSLVLPAPAVAEPPTSPTPELGAPTGSSGTRGSGS